MTTVQANGIELEYETTGVAQDPPMVLIMGHGAQLIDWPEPFCDQLAARGFWVVRFDNRDAGLSTGMDGAVTPSFAESLSGELDGAPYTLADMAADTVGLLDALGIGRAHIVGASMGGMIAQQLVIDHPGRVASLCSIMSSTGDRTVGRPSPEALAALARPPAADRAEALRGAVDAALLAAGSGSPVSEDAVLRHAVATYDRANRPDGRLRQFAAIVTAPDRTAALHAVTVPTVVIHGDEDPLVNVSGARATAAAIPGAELLVVPGMGHELPPGAWPQIVDAIAGNAKKA